jgi:hypothetical protein
MSRPRREVTVAEFADGIGVHQSLVYRWLLFEDGKEGGNPPTVDNALAIARATKNAVPVANWESRKVATATEAT